MAIKSTVSFVYTNGIPTQTFWEWLQANYSAQVYQDVQNDYQNTLVSRLEADKVAGSLIDYSLEPDDGKYFIHATVADQQAFTLNFPQLPLFIQYKNLYYNAMGINQTISSEEV